MDFDVILKDIGEFGRYQKLLFVFVILPACLPGGFHGFSQLFSVGTPENYSCHIPINNTLYNFSIFYQQSFIPPLDNGEPSKCDMYDVDYSNATQLYTFQPNHTRTIACQYGWDYDTSVYKKTAATEWNLVCARDFFPTLSIEIHTLGTLFGSLLFGYLGDRLGRKKAFYIAAMLQLISGLVTIAAPNFIVFCCIRFVNGITIVPVWILPLIMGLELIGPTKRAPVGVTMSVFYTLGVVGLATVAFFIRDWIPLQLTVTLPFSIFVFWWWLLPESPRWLMSQGRFDEMMVIVRKIAKVNGVVLMEKQIDKWQDRCRVAYEEEQAQRRYNLLDLFRTPNLRMKTILVVFNSFSNYAVYNGLNFFVPHLGDEHVSFLLSALVELPSYLILYLTLNRFGRRVILMSTMVTGGIFSIIAATMMTTANQIVLVIFFLMSKFCITCSFFVTDLVASELFPTVVRGAGASLTQTVSAVGLCISPIISHLAKHYIFVPLIIFGVLAIVGGGTTLILPETANTMLPETLEEGEAFGKNMTWKERLRFLPQKTQSTVVHRSPSLSEARVLLNGNHLVPVDDKAMPIQ
ncbi:beta-alanine transporter-like [Paramacrobiotus metropolitanus]|uniref:beta-alanine transporter-like n=1 Tax=Paramacrobiotus metropolitanus TaxID=2943436 RepID=UPI0024461FBD|nr:beta-alanine transporter-like [Paramacrobiotus metropolitanus]